jgi:ATP-dependent Clp protease ATP-binding subunit ClpC
VTDRFEKFTHPARTALSLAQEEALRFKHNYIGTEHLLLGLVREGEGVAAQVLTGLGFDLDKVRRAVEVIVGQGDHVVMGEIRLTPRLKKVLELAVDEARQLKHDHIDTEHLLLGLIREGQGIAAGILTERGTGLSLDQVRSKVMDLLRHGPSNSDA